MMVGILMQTDFIKIREQFTNHFNSRNKFPAGVAQSTGLITTMTET
jgi:hypothetical protein